jgi:hypothetical protein
VWLYPRRIGYQCRIEAAVQQISRSLSCCSLLWVPKRSVKTRVRLPIQQRIQASWQHRATGTATCPAWSGATVASLAGAINKVGSIAAPTSELLASQRMFSACCAATSLQNPDSALFHRHNAYPKCLKRSSIDDVHFGRVPCPQHSCTKPTEQRQYLVKEQKAGVCTPFPRSA